MGEWYESIICVMISIDVLSHTITVMINIRAKAEVSEMVLLPQSSEDYELVFKALLAQFYETSQYLINQARLYVIYVVY